MMIVRPAWALGGLVCVLVVFVAGYWVTSAVLTRIAKRRKVGQTLHRDTLQPVVRRAYLTEKGIDRISIAGGVVAVGLVVLLLFTVLRPAFREHWTAIMIVLTIIGIIGGISTFFLLGSTPRSAPPRKYRPPSSPGTRIRPSSPSTSRPSQEEPCRTLLIMAYHDKSLADRLVEYERKQAPDASRDELCRSAVERWKRDHR